MLMGLVVFELGMKEIMGPDVPGGMGDMRESRDGCPSRPMRRLTFFSRPVLVSHVIYGLAGEWEERWRAKKKVHRRGVLRYTRNMHRMIHFGRARSRSYAEAWELSDVRLTVRSAAGRLRVSNVVMLYESAPAGSAEDAIEFVARICSPTARSGAASAASSCHHSIAIYSHPSPSSPSADPSPANCVHPPTRRITLRIHRN